MARIALKLNEKNPAALIVFAQEVHDQLLANITLFATPTIQLTDFKTAIDDLQAAHQNTLMGGTAATVFRDDKMRVLQNMLRTLAAYVTSIAQGDATIITNAGMELAKQGPYRYEFIDVPVDVRVVCIGGGMMSMRWRKVRNAKSYEVEYTLDPNIDSSWQRMPVVSGSNTMVNGLKRKEEYWFRVRAVGTKLLFSDWSSPAKQVAF
jgi:hypothetical protein